VLRGVEETATMEEPEDLRRATELWQEAYREQMDGELDRAMERSPRSIESPPGETHTFLSWALSVQGRWNDATDECRRAIAIDPQFGNPSNDIGVYLTQAG
jgi:Tfp pilus assembly protein PilF